MMNPRTFAALIVLGAVAACTAAEPTSPSAEAARPLASSLIGSGNGTSTDSTTVPPGDD